MLARASSPERVVGKFGAATDAAQTALHAGTEDMPETNDSGGYPLSARQISRLIAAVTVFALVAVPSAVAGKPGSGGTTGGTISIVLLDSTDGLPHYGQRVTFDVSTTATTTPYVNLRCYQNGTLVGQSWEAFFDGSLDDQIMVLGGSTAWQSGAADCTATLNKRTKRGWQLLASTSFHVYA
jgi:hypothetical protein